MTTRLRVVTWTAIVATSPVTTASVAVRVGLNKRRLAGRRYRLEGATWPAVPAGRVSLQRQSRSGRWGAVARARPTALSGGRSRYRFTVPRRSRALSYRVVVLARDGGAHVPGTSRTVTLPRRYGTSHNAASGGSVTAAEKAGRARPTASASTPPRLPTLRAAVVGSESVLSDLAIVARRRGRRRGSRRGRPG